MLLLVHVVVSDQKNTFLITFKRKRFFFIYLFCWQRRKKWWDNGTLLAISESVARTDQHLKALLLITRGTDDLDGESGTELTLRFYQREWKMQVAFWEVFASGSPSSLVPSTV